MIKPHLSVSYLPLSSKSDLFYLLPQFSISYLKWPSACVYLQRSAAIERIQADNDIIMLQFQSNEIPSPTVNLRCWPLEGEGDHFAKKRLQQWGWGAQDFQTKEVKKGALDGGRIEVGDLEDGTVGHCGPRYCGSWPSKHRWANVLHMINRRVNCTMQIQN